MDILAYLLSAPIAREPRAAAFDACPFEGHVQRALWGGFHADRLGYAFAAGYRAALARLFVHAGLPAPRGLVALAATESGGAHPRAIATSLESAPGDENSALVLRGDKTFATLASVADELLVVATRGESPEGKKKLCVVRVARTAPGVVVTPRPETPFAPEIPHAFVRLDAVRLAPDQVLPGDGYDVWLKPFRTIEDVHVLAGTCGYLAGAARAYGWLDAVDELVALAASLVGLGARDASAPLTHLLLDGTFAAARRLVSSLPWDSASDDERARWHRDAPLLVVAESARKKRTETARRALGAG